MSIEENKAKIKHWWEEMLYEDKIEKANEFVADDYVYHGPGDYIIKGIEGFKKYIAWVHDDFPGAHFTIDDLIAEGDKVVTLYTMKGTDKSNKPVEFQGVVISHIVNGKEVEVWEIFDRFTLALQLAPGWVKGILRSIEKQMVKDQPWQS